MITIEFWGGPLDGSCQAMESLVEVLRIPVLVPPEGQPDPDKPVALRMTEVVYRPAGVMRHGRQVYRWENPCR